MNICVALSVFTCTVMKQTGTSLLNQMMHWMHLHALQLIKKKLYVTRLVPSPVVLKCSSNAPKPCLATIKLPKHH